MSDFQTRYADEIFRSKIRELGLMNQFLKDRYGNEASTEFFEFLAQQVRKDIVKSNPQLSLEEFAEVYSNWLLSNEQIHIETTENPGVVQFFVFDCLPLKIVSSSRPAITATDFPCKIWSQRLVPAIAANYGLEGSMVKRSDGCYCTIKKKP